MMMTFSRIDDNAEHSHRHAYRALEDFQHLRRKPEDKKLWHALSHHLRHVVFRTGLDVPSRMRRYARRHTE